MQVDLKQSWQILVVHRYMQKEAWMFITIITTIIVYVLSMERFLVDYSSKSFS